MIEEYQHLKKSKTNKQTKASLLDLCRKETNKQRGLMRQKSLHSFSSWPDDYTVKVVKIHVDSSVILSPQEEPSLEQLGPPLGIKYFPYWPCMCYSDK